MVSKQIRFITRMQVSVDDSVLGHDTQYSRANLGIFIHALLWGNKSRMTENYSGNTVTSVYSAE